MEDATAQLEAPQSKRPRPSSLAESKSFDGFDYEHRGANFAFVALAEEFKENLFSSLPKLNEVVTSVILEYGARKQLFDLNYLQSLNVALNVVIILLPVLNKPRPLEDMLDELLPNMILACTNSDPDVSDLAARAVALSCKHSNVKSMQVAIEKMLPLLEKQEDIHARLGVCVCLRYIIETLGLDILPWVVFLIIPILGRMSDPDRQVREKITYNFATLVKLMPLEASIPDPPGKSNRLLLLTLDQVSILSL